jgi:hypothetical protein
MSLKLTLDFLTTFGRLEEFCGWEIEAKFAHAHTATTAWSLSVTNVG